MSRGVNKVILIGNLGKDPAIHNMQSGQPVANFSLATQEEWKDKNTGNKEQRSEWHNIVAFNKMAEICAKYLKKGSKVYIEGMLRTKKWQDKNGIERYTTEIIANEMQMLDGKNKESQPEYQYKSSHHDSSNTNNLEEIPF